jgi:hypothetical protein
MNLTIIAEDNSIYINKEHWSPCDLSFLDSNIRAVQWDSVNNIGHCEYKNGANENLTSFKYLEETIKSFENCKELFRLKQLEKEETERLEKINRLRKLSLPVENVVGGDNVNFDFPNRSDVLPAISVVANCWVKQMVFNKKDDVHEGHMHVFDHQTLLAKGKIELYVNGEVTTFTAPQIIFIKAGLRHGMIALEDDTIVYCLHPLRDGEQVEDIISPDQVPNGVMPLTMDLEKKLIPTTKL